MTAKSHPLIAALCGAALLAGCGDSDSDSLSYDETGDELNALCQQYDTAGEEEKLTGRVENDATVLAQITEQTGQALDEIRGLDVHEELTEARDEFVTLGEESLERGQTLQQLAEDGDQRGYLQQIREYQRAAKQINAETDEAASKLGAPACGQNA